MPQYVRFELGVVRARDPDRSAAVLPVVAAPRFAAGLAGARNRVEAPNLLAGLHVVRGDEAADTVLAAARADDHQVLDDERRHRHGVRELRIGHRCIPKRLAVARVDRDQVRVERAHEQRVAVNREAAIVGAAADALVGRVVVAVLPEHAARLGVERQHVVGALRQIHDAVDDERRGLPRAEHLALQHPLLLEVADVLRRDLSQRRVALARIGAGVGQPVLRLVSGANDAFGRDRAARRAPAASSQRQNATASDAATSGGRVIFRAPSAKRDRR